MGNLDFNGLLWNPQLTQNLSYKDVKQQESGSLTQNNSIFQNQSIFSKEGMNFQIGQLGQGTEKSPSKTKLVFKNARGKSNFGINLGGQAMDLIGDMIPTDTYDDKYGNLTQAADQTYDTASDIAMKANPLVGTIMKGAGALAKGIRNLTGTTDGETKVDSIMNSVPAQILGVGIINNLGAEKTDTISKDTEAFAEVGGSYTGTESDIDTAVGKSGKKYGLLSRRKLEKVNSQIAEANRQQDIVENIADETRDRRELASTSSIQTQLQRQFDLYGGWDFNAALTAKQGAKLTLARSLLKRIQQKNFSKFKEKDSIIEPTIIHLVERPTAIQLLSIEDVPEFKDGGSIIELTDLSKPAKRSVDELIAYAKKQNPAFIQRLSEEPKGIWFWDKDGKPAQGSHYLAWEYDDDGTAIVFPVIQEVHGTLQYLGDKALKAALQSNNYLRMSPEEAKDFSENYKQGWPEFFQIFKHGGSVNIIPEGALHARKHNLDLEGVTSKGIPVISNEGEQCAEIEKEEIIFRLEVTETLERLYKKYQTSTPKEKDQYAQEAGELLVEEILNNTIDKTNNLL